MKITYAAPTASLQRWFWWLLLVNVLFIICSRFYLQPLTSGDIVRFEVAKEASVAESIVHEWKQVGKYNKAVQSIYIDYLFIILYTSGLAVACAFLSRLTGHEILIRSGKGASWLLAIAGICDVIENVTMTKSLQGAITHWNVMLTYDMAAAKFSVIILCLLFILVCLIFWLSNKLFSKRNSSMFF
ncbi:hypothetical protein HB364_03370 [Pseudoflavitalea sp. X16]|uniref:hypothetical protein n=1 Tax=Paraflavitalea devenefica TaxID=2716334 RepID=UPI00141FB5A1|nr:hypothetical protein [Paraflavitalea devenefica]NII24105.1 hypothetical protein [Paraflavitalea devenefica]